RTTFHPRAVGGKRVDDRTDVQPRGLAEVARFVTVRARDGDDQVVAVDNDLRARNTEPVDAGADDLLCLRERLPRRPRPVGRPCGQCDPRAALQVDAELGVGMLVAGKKHQQVDADKQNQECRQVAARVHRRRRRCHVLSLLRLCAMRFVAGSHTARPSRADQFDRTKGYVARHRPQSLGSRPGSSARSPTSSGPVSRISGSIRSLIASLTQVVTTPGAISRSTVSSVMRLMVACSPEVVCTWSPIRSDSCRSMVACIARFCRREAKNMNTPRMASIGRKVIAWFMTAAVFP